MLDCQIGRCWLAFADTRPNILLPICNNIWNFGSARSVAFDTSAVIQYRVAQVVASVTRSQRASNVSSST